MKVTDKYIFFWGGIYSQWYPSKFTIKGIEYNCAEQYMMAKKAEIFGDLDILNKIMIEKDPKAQKAYGRKVKNFDAKKWTEVCKKVVYDANYAKFTQNKGLLNELMSTGSKEIVEASPYDKIWGIGLSENDPLIHNKSNWKGTNWLGIEIMKVRENLKNNLEN